MAHVVTFACNLMQTRESVWGNLKVTYVELLYNKYHWIPVTWTFKGKLKKIWAFKLSIFSCTIKINYPKHSWVFTLNLRKMQTCLYIKPTKCSYTSLLDVLNDFKTNQCVLIMSTIYLTFCSTLHIPFHHTQRLSVRFLQTAVLQWSPQCLMKEHPETKTSLKINTHSSKYLPSILTASLIPLFLP